MNDHHSLSLFFLSCVLSALVTISTLTRRGARLVASLSSQAIPKSRIGDEKANYSNYFILFFHFSKTTSNDFSFDKVFSSSRERI